ncbi:MAG TPA: hypothetical protein PKY82_05350 [Pyrinomonadaceae bacterium]|nr:hypothetical protein [Pyrinomonadaceae bacterium]
MPLMLAFVPNPIVIATISFVVVIVVVLFLGFLLRRFSKSRTKRAMEEWEKLAEQLGLKVETGKETAIYPMTGVYDGREVKLAVGFRSSGDGGGVNFTFCQTRINPPLRLMLKINSEKGILNDALGVMAGESFISSGNAEFDKEFNLFALDRERLSQFLGQKLLDGFAANLANDLLQAKPHFKSVLLTDGYFYIEDKGAIYDLERLKVMLNWVVYVASRAENSNQLLPLSVWEKVLIQTWKAFAEQNGMRFDEKNLILKGLYKGFETQVNLGRSNEQTWLTEFKFDFGKSLMTGLQILQQNSLHEFVAFLGAQDIQVGDAVFDKLFVVKAENVQTVQHLLKPDLCQQLIKLNTPAKTLKIDDEEIFLSTESVVNDESSLQSYLDEIAKTAQMFLRQN